MIEDLEGQEATDIDAARKSAIVGCRTFIADLIKGGAKSISVEYRIYDYTGGEVSRFAAFAELP